MPSGLLDQIKKPERDIPSVDPSAKQLVWTGHATKVINPSKDPQKNQRNIDKVMQKLLKDFPPRRK